VSPHTDEKVVNGALAAALDERHPRWRAVAEQTGLVAARPSLCLDILVSPEGTGLLDLPIETEFHPAATVEQDAQARLGLQLITSGRRIRKALAVRMPADLGSLSGQRLDNAVRDPATRFEWCLLSEDDDTEEKAAGGGPLAEARLAQRQRKRAGPVLRAAAGRRRGPEPGG